MDEARQIQAKVDELAERLEILAKAYSTGQILPKDANPDIWKEMYETRTLLDEAGQIVANFA